jgi:hypothetical protein
MVGVALIESRACDIECMQTQQDAQSLSLEMFAHEHHAHMLEQQRIHTRCTGGSSRADNVAPRRPGHAQRRPQGECRDTLAC